MRNGRVKKILRYCTRLYLEGMIDKIVFIGSKNG